MPRTTLVVQTSLLIGASRWRRSWPQPTTSFRPSSSGFMQMTRRRASVEVDENEVKRMKEQLYRALIVNAQGSASDLVRAPNTWRAGLGEASRSRSMPRRGPRSSKTQLQLSRLWERHLERINRIQIADTTKFAGLRKVDQKTMDRSLSITIIQDTSLHKSICEGTCLWIWLRKVVALHSKLGFLSTTRQAQ